MKKGKTLKTFIALFTIGAFFIPQLSMAADYYVDFTSGTDSGDCTNTGSPCQTFGAAGLAGVTAGDNVNCTGTYDGTTGTDIFLTWSGSSGNPVTIQQWTGQSRPVIDMTANPGVWVNFGIGFNGDHVNFDGFEVASDSTSNSMANIFSQGSTDLTISNCEIHGAQLFGSKHGVFATDTVNLKLENNELYNNDSNTVLGGSNAYINANRIYDSNGNSMTGLAIGNHDSPLITNNYLYHFTNGFSLFLGNPMAPPGSYHATDTLILNNSFYDNRGAVFAGAVSGTHSFINNIIYSDSINYTGLNDFTGSTSYFDNLTSNYNDFYIGSTDRVAGWRVGFSQTYYDTLADWQGASWGQDADSIDDDPEFKDLTPGSIDLDLEDTSPCENAGTSTAPYVTDDIYGTARPQGSAYDIGAYEIISIPAPGTPTNVIATNITNNSADITWDAASLASHYEVAYSLNSDMSAAATDTVTSTSDALTGLADGTTYYVRVRGKYYSGGWITGNWSYKINFETNITAPSNFEVVYSKAKKAKFSWDLDEAAAASIPENLYILEISERSDFADPIIIENIKNKHYIARQLKTSNHYFARVKAVTAEDKSRWSETIDFRTYPKKPDAIKVARKGYNSAYLHVKRIPRIKKMRAIILKKNSKGWQRIGKFTLNGHKKTRRKPVKVEMTGLEQGQLYKVRAKGIWTNKNVGTYKGKASVGITFEL